MIRADRDVVVIGAGPNGLAAAIELARAGLSVLIVEGADTPGGGARTEALTVPGYLHDVCSSVHPLGVGSPFFRELGLERHGLSWIDPPSLLAHIVDASTAVTLERSISATAEQLGPDGGAYRRIFEPLRERFDELATMVLGPLRWPSAPLLLARFGLLALQPLQDFCELHFQGRAAPALLAGIASHAMLPLDAAATTSFGLVLASAGHAFGWPIARGGSVAITAALCATLRELGGELVTGHTVRSLRELPRARAYVFDTTPRQLLAIAGDALPAVYRWRLQQFQYGPGVYKIDWALSEPIPWRHAACRQACTVHLAGELAEVSAAEAAVHGGSAVQHPFVLLVQPSLFDPSRAPAGRHTAWAYCHVPHGSQLDMLDAIESLVELHAPGFRDVILARCGRGAVEMEAYNPNYVGGDINAGLASLGQLFFRPVVRADPYSTPAPHLFLCSSSTPPGGGVHGMCGYWAARSVLRRAFGRG